MLSATNRAVSLPSYPAKGVSYPARRKKRLVRHVAHIAVSVPKSALLSFVKTWREKIFALARKFFISRTKTEKISRVFSRIYEPQSEHFRHVNLPRIALSPFVGCLISHFDAPASGKSCRICLFWQAYFLYICARIGGGWSVRGSFPYP